MYRSLRGPRLMDRSLRGPRLRGPRPTQQANNTMFIIINYSLLPHGNKGVTILFIAISSKLAMILFLVLSP